MSTEKRECMKLYTDTEFSKLFTEDHQLLPAAKTLIIKSNSRTSRCQLLPNIWIGICEYTLRRAKNMQTDMHHGAAPC